MEKFFATLLDSLNMEPDDVVEEGTVLKEIDGWDSLGKFMLLSNIYSDYGVTLEVEDVNLASTAGDLWKLVQSAKPDA